MIKSESSRSVTTDSNTPKKKKKEEVKVLNIVFVQRKYRRRKERDYEKRENLIILIDC